MVSPGGFDPPSICPAGFILRRKGQHDLAIADYTKAVELNPKDQQTYFLRGLAYDKIGQDELAIADFTKVIELDPKDEKAYVQAGFILRHKRTG